MRSRMYLDRLRKEQMALINLAWNDIGIAPAALCCPGSRSGSGYFVADPPLALYARDVW